MTRLAAAVAGGLVLVLLAPAFSHALLTFGVARVLNAFFFAATLAGRSEFAPREARGQVFIWVGALKIAAGAAGTTAAGATRPRRLAPPRPRHHAHLRRNTHFDHRPAHGHE